jgi:hypothetical protein
MGITGFSPAPGETRCNVAVIGAIRASLVRFGAAAAFPAQPLDFVHELAGAARA